MKRAGFKVQPDKHGWIRTTLSPVKDRQEVPFGLVDILMFFALVAITVAIARVVLAH